MFVSNLARILREHFYLRVNKHEHWTFFKVAEWEVCTSPGECHTHGMSEEFEARMEANPSDQSLWWADCQYPYKIQVYLGQASLWADGKAVEVRVRIEATHNDAMGDMFTAQVWVKPKNEPILNAHFYLYNNDQPCTTDEDVPAYPPDRIAFWRKEETSSRDLPSLRIRELRIMHTREEIYS